jgi:hypothetical protein
LLYNEPASKGNSVRSKIYVAIMPGKRNNINSMKLNSSVLEEAL